MLKDKTLADEQRQELEMHADKLAGIVLSAWLPYGLFRKLLTHSHCFQIVPLALLIFYKDGMHYITHQDDTCRHACFPSFHSTWSVTERGSPVFLPGVLPLLHSWG